MNQPEVGSKDAKGLESWGVAFASLRSGLRYERLTLHDFVTSAWPIVEQGRTFINSFHIEAMCEYLEAVTLGKLTRLIINIPPRYGKSTIVSVMWPVWEWTLFPSRRFMFCSYSAGLSTKHSIARRRVIESEWYKRHWGTVVAIERDQNVKTEYENTRRGVMVSTSTGGTATGKGGDTLVGDDILNPTLAESKLERENAIEFIDHTWSSRLDDKKTGKMVFIEQRLHAQDITAHLTRQGGWTQLIMPAEFSDKTTYVLPMSGRSIIKEPGDLLAPEREGRDELDGVRRLMGTRAYQAQYLQRPSAEEGALLKRSWFRCYTTGHVRAEYFRIWSWDTAAKEGEQNDYSCGTYWSATPDGFFLLDRVKVRLTYPSLKKEVRERCVAQPCSALLIEDTSSGQALIPDLKLLGLPVIPVKVDKDKVLRVNLQAPAFEAGMVWIPEATPSTSWVVDFKDELCEFPAVEHDDQVDSAMMALAYMRARTSSMKPASSMSGGGMVTTERRPDWL